MMSVPSHREAALILLDLEPPDWLVRHSAAVAEICSFLAGRIGERGGSVDRALVEAAGLLHDVDKLLAGDDPLRTLGHAEAGAEWLRRRGHPELAGAVAHHPATLLSDERRYPSWAQSAALEERVVAYADKRAEQDVVPMAQRFAAWRARHPEYADQLALAYERAELLEREVCAAAGVTPADVSRSAWFDEVAAAAEAGQR